MQIDNAFQAKREIFRDMLRFKEAPGSLLETAGATARSLWLDPGALSAVEQGATYRSAKMNIAVGVGAPREPRREDEYAVTLFLQDRRLNNSPLVTDILSRFRRECEVRYVGRVRRLSGRPWQQGPVRPLKAGASIGHNRITAGTLGCFVRMRRDNAICALSNNHVLAWTNRAAPGDAILQPGKGDGGHRPNDQIGTLHHYVPLELGGARINLVDCAVATVFPSVARDYASLEGIGKLAGRSNGPLRIGTEVAKLGRTTDITTGRIAAIEVDQVIVAMESQGLAQIARFDGQIVVEGTGDAAFSKGGDSGSIVVDGSCQAVGLLFAGTSEGGVNNRGVTFVNPIGDVESALDADIYVG